MGKIVDVEWMRWMKMGEDDLDSARVNFDNGKYYVCSYLCHQSVEKALKSGLIKNKVGIIKTHDLALLGRKINVPQNLLELCGNLSLIFIETKYGTDIGGVPSQLFSKGDSEKHLKYAGEVLEWIKKNI